VRCETRSERSELCPTDQSSGVVCRIDVRRSRVKFTDWAGSRVRIRAAQIRSIVEITPEQRAPDRKLWRALRREEKADRRVWEDDDQKDRAPERISPGLDRIYATR
jgi:hypothetical protein